MATSSVERRARDLLLEEDGGNPDTSPYPPNLYDQRLRAAIAKISAQDREQTQTKSDAEFQAQYLANRRHELAEQLDSAITQVNRLVQEYQSVHRKHMDARAEAGLPYDPSTEPRAFLPTWLRHRLGNFDSPVGVPLADLADIGSQHVSLADRDTLAQRREAG